MQRSIYRYLVLSRTDQEVVAEGCAFTNGKCVTSWCRDNFPNSVAVFDSIRGMKQVHTELGPWEVLFVDQLPQSINPALLR